MVISKQLACPKYIYKIHSSRLRKERWRLTLPIDEARKNDEIISLADSQILRWIDELNGITDFDERARVIKSKIKVLRKEPYSSQNKRTIRKLYKNLDELQFKSDYMCLVIDKNKDYIRACKGFHINGIKYKRLLGTNGGIKNNTIVFVSERLHEELSRRIENGRNQSKKLVTAKLEAYKALACSASIPVSMPKGILVVDDVYTQYNSDIVKLTDECDGEPRMALSRNENIEMDASDGYGLILPSLAERWSNELGLGYTASCLNTRFSWEKGVVCAFDYIDFAEKVANNYIVKDAWGNDVDVREVELVLTTSMVKLWDSYESCEHYMSESIKNGYTFSITKTSPRQLESKRNLNYQFIQSFDLNDDDIGELIAPTMNEIRDVLGGDWRKTVLFLKGSGLNATNVPRLDNDFVKGIMIEKELLEDPFVRHNVHQLIRNRINEAKVGVLKVHGNYSIVVGDPYLLCQSFFGMETTGLLKAGEIYNKYWADFGSEKVVCFRAPMTCHENIVMMSPVRNDAVQCWYRYMATCTVLNGWDTTTAAMNGMDYDGDIIMITDNPVLIRKYKTLPTLMCAQRQAEKRVSTEEDFIKSNIESFGNDIGRVTNYITSMFEVRAGFEKGSVEYETLSYRIKCGQLYQQNTIDAAKGIIAKPMPRYWYDKHVVNKIEDAEQRELCRKIVADRKPYFMRYIYPDLMKQYNTYIKNTNMNALREFQISVSELQDIPSESLTERQSDFLKYYEYRMPVGINDCIMNKICKRFEEAFDGYVSKNKSDIPFDYTIMKSEEEYTPKQYSAIRKLYNDYNKLLSDFSAATDQKRIDKTESRSSLQFMNDEFRSECDKICPNSKALCNIVLDICYSKNSTKKFAWGICGNEIIQNLLSKNSNTISFPAANPDGDFEYCGNRYTVETIEVEVNE